ELLAILPRNLFDRQILFALEVAWIVAHHRLPLFLRDEMHAHVETLAQGDFVLGFIILPFRFTVRASHQERTRRNPGKLHPKAVRDDLSWLSLLLRRMGLLPLFPHFLNNLLGSFLVNVMQFAHLIGGSRVVLRRLSLRPVQGFTDKQSQLGFALLLQPLQFLSFPVGFFLFLTLPFQFGLFLLLLLL